MRYLVTGGTGKVGNAVARALADRGDEVVALVRQAARGREALPPGIELAVGHVNETDALARAVEGADGVFNCMGLPEQWLRDDGRFDQVNAQGSLNVIRAAREAGVKRALHTSTFDVFHADRGGTVREDVVADYPKNTAYERSKQHAEELVLAEAENGIEVVIANPASVFGPGPGGTGLDRLIRDGIRRRLPATPPGGMTMVYVDDVASGHLAAFERGEPGERYVLADGFSPCREIVRAAVGAAGRGWVPPSLPERAARGMAATGEAISNLIKRPPLMARGELEFLLWEARADSSKAQRELGFEPTDWREGIECTVRWMSDSGQI